MSQTIRPEHYKKCSDMGKEILATAGFNSELLDKECLETIDFLGADFYIGNCLKYLWRLGQKNSIKILGFRLRSVKSINNDLKKALTYAELFLERNEKRLENSSEYLPWIRKLRTVILAAIKELNQ